MGLGGSAPPRLVDPLLSAATFSAALLLVAGTIGIGEAETLAAVAAFLSA